MSDNPHTRYMNARNEHEAAVRAEERARAAFDEARCQAAEAERVLDMAYVDSLRALTEKAHQQPTSGEPVMTVTRLNALHLHAVVRFSNGALGSVVRIENDFESSRRRTWFRLHHGAPAAETDKTGYVPSDALWEASDDRIPSLFVLYDPVQ